MNNTLDQLAIQIGNLSPARRRVLFRKLKAMGLIEAENLLSDRDPLRIALAVPLRAIENEDKRLDSDLTDPRPPRPADRPRRNAPRSSDNSPALSAPDNQRKSTQLAPPPALTQAPNEPIRIVFDGGSRGNPGKGYGSFALDWPGYSREIVQLTFGDQATNNEAEYDTLIAALEAVRDRIAELQIDPRSAILSIWGDSLLVCNQVRGKWACKEPRLQVRLNSVKELLSGFGKSELNHQPREKSVEILGH